MYPKTETLNLVQKSHAIDCQSHGKLRGLTNRTSLSESIACTRGLSVCTDMEHGPFGNWNPAPLVHPNGSVLLLAHTKQYGLNTEKRFSWPKRGAARTAWYHLIMTRGGKGPLPTLKTLSCMDW